VRRTQFIRFKFMHIGSQWILEVSRIGSLEIGGEGPFGGGGKSLEEGVLLTGGPTYACSGRVSWSARPSQVQALKALGMVLLSQKLRLLFRFVT
jgi:hypothetical protein